jgi:hypothetical protein
MTARKQTDAAAPADVSREPADVSRETSATGPAPTVGRLIHYRLSTQDVADINRRRRRSAAAPKNEWGYIAPRGNPVSTGQIVPAVVTATYGGTTINANVLLDGTDTLWVTSRPHGDEAGQWCWPERV